MVKKDAERHYLYVSLGMYYWCDSGCREYPVPVPITITLLIVFPQCIAGGIGVAWYFTHNNPSHQQPKVFGGSADEGITSTTSSSVSSSSSTAIVGISSSPHVSPTNTVARRATFPDPAPTHIPFQMLHSPHAQSGSGRSGGVHLVPSKRHSRQVNRTRH